MKENKKSKKNNNNNNKGNVLAKKRIYMDYAATTPVDTRALKAMQQYFGVEFANASAVYKEGVDIKKVLDDLRVQIAEIIKAQSDEIIFTSGGTESNNLAIFGIIMALEKNGMAIKDMHAITSVIEHPSVLECFREFESRGLNVSYIRVDEDGIVNPKDIRDELRSETVLVSIMYINNEIGTIQPIHEIAKVLRHFRKQNSKANKLQVTSYKLPFFHTDASQAPLYLDCNTAKLGVDMMTVCGHKMYGPKGIGFLYKKRGVVLESIIKGGGQESGLRAGTENIPLIIGLAEAFCIADKERNRETERLTKIRDYFISEALKKIKGAILNGSSELRVANNINISIQNIDSEFFVIVLDNKGISCASKSACFNTKTKEDDSYVINALGADEGRAKSALRFTLGKETKKSDVDYVVKILSESVKNFELRNSQ